MKLGETPVPTSALRKPMLPTTVNPRHLPEADDRSDVPVSRLHLRLSQGPDTSKVESPVKVK